MFVVINDIVLKPDQVLHHAAHELKEEIEDAQARRRQDFAAQTLIGAKQSLVKALTALAREVSTTSDLPSHPAAQEMWSRLELPSISVPGAGTLKNRSVVALERGPAPGAAAKAPK